VARARIHRIDILENIATSSILRAPLLESIGWLDHGFGTRESRIDQEPMASVKQIHSGTVLLVDRAGLAGEGDGLVTGATGVAVSVRTADCYPILLVDTRRRVVAAVHAGWRGTTARIVTTAVELMCRRFDTSPSDIYAAIGPGIGECCYPVGEEVGRMFGLPGAGRVDLAKQNRAQLMEARVPESQIERTGLCTSCDAARFYSYRREQSAAGRMISFIGIRPE
jgi:YfiH family protein